MSHLTIEPGATTSKNRVLCDGVVVDNVAFVADKGDHYLISITKSRAHAARPIETATLPPYETRGKRNREDTEESN